MERIVAAIWIALLLFFLLWFTPGAASAQLARSIELGGVLYSGGKPAPAPSKTVDGAFGMDSLTLR